MNCDLPFSTSLRRKSKFLDTVCVCAGCVENHNAFFGALVDGYVVDAGTCSCDGKQTFGEFNIMKCGGTHHYTFVIRAVLGKGKF